MKSIMLLLILVSLSPAYAQMSCMDLFKPTRPSEEEINTTIIELAHLRSQQYSKDLALSYFARIESQKKFLELGQYLTKSEIRERINKIEEAGLIKNVTLNENERQKHLDATKEIIEKIEAEAIQEANLKKFMHENDFHDIHSPNEISNIPIILAAKQNKIQIVETLIAHGADINVKDHSGYTALMHTSASGFTDTVQRLIELGADLNHEAKDRSTALRFANWNHKDDVVKILTAAGATK